jgi:type II secretory pathway pseudopilin PulG
VSGRKLALALAAIAVLAFVLPPLAARQVHARRIDRATEAMARLATTLSAEANAIRADATGREPIVLAGKGAVPVFAPGVGWAAERVSSLEDGVRPHFASGPAKWGQTPSPPTQTPSPQDISPDSWGNQYLVIVFSSPGSTKTVTVVSAGPNGIIETAFGPALIARGDDLVAVR